MAIAACLLLSVIGVMLLYLCSPNQRWRRLPLRGRAWHVAAWALVALAWPAWMVTLEAKAGFFAALTLLMLLAGLLPLVSLLKLTRAAR